MEINIRRAEQKDCPAMLELIHELALYERAPAEVTVSLEHFEASGFSEHPVFYAFVAEHGKQVVGFALYYIRYSTWKGQMMYLEDIIVTEPWRGKGIGSTLLDRLIKEAEEKRLAGLTWQVLDWNESAIRFYNKYNPVYSSEWLNASIYLNRIPN